MAPTNDTLTPDERDLFSRVRAKHSSEEIAAKARVSVSTVTRAGRGDQLTRAAADAVRRALAELSRGA